MIAKINYSTFKDMSLTQGVNTQQMVLTAGYEGSSAKECPVMIVCTCEELADVFDKVNKNSNVVGYYVSGSVDFNKLVEILTKYDTERCLNVIVPYKFNGEHDRGLVDGLKYFESVPMLNKHLKTLVQLPEGYSDMKYVKDMCTKYRNIRYTGGMLLGLDGCNIGVIENDDLPKKIPDNRLPIVYENDQCVDVMVDYLDMENISWDNGKVKKEATVKEPKAKEPKPKKENKPAKKTIIASKFSVADDDEF